MLKPTLNYAWVGPPMFNDGGQDVCGPESLAMNFKKFSADGLPSNPILFWCQEQYVSDYQAYFFNQRLDIQVVSIDRNLIRCVRDHNDELHNEADSVLKYYTHNILNNSGSKTSDYVRMKDLLFTFILAARGGYVLDTNIQACSDEPVAFDAYEKFMYPLLKINEDGVTRDAPEVWMQYSPENDLTQAKKCLRTYLKILKDEPYTRRYLALSALKACEEAQFATWDISHDLSPDVYVPKMGVFKEYYNSHVTGKKTIYPAPYFHVLEGDLYRLSYDLQHGILPNRTINLTNTEYEVQNETLLNLAVRQFSSKNDNGLRHVNCIILLLQNGADPNIATAIVNNQTGRKNIFSALTLAIMMKGKSALPISILELLFTHTKENILVNQILNNESPLMLAVAYRNIDAIKLLLKYGADVNQTWAGQQSNPLTMALSLPDNNEIILLLRANGAKALNQGKKFEQSRGVLSSSDGCSVKEKLGEVHKLDSSTNDYPFKK